MPKSAAKPLPVPSANARSALLSQAAHLRRAAAALKSRKLAGVRAKLLATAEEYEEEANRPARPTPRPSGGHPATACVQNAIERGLCYASIAFVKGAEDARTPEERTGFNECHALTRAALVKARELRSLSQALNPKQPSPRLARR